MNEDQLRAAIEQAVKENKVNVVTELAPILEQKINQRERKIKESEGRYVAASGLTEEDFGQFTENVGKAPEEFTNFAKQQASAAIQGDIGYGRAGFNIAAKGGFDALNTVVSEGIQLATKNAMVQIFPNQMEEYVANKIKDTVMPLIDNPVTKKGLEILSGPAGYVRDAWVNYSTENPNDAATIEGVVNVAQWLKPPSLRGPAPDTTAGLLGRAGDSLYESGRKKIVKADRGFLLELASPVPTQEILRNQARTNVKNKWGTLEVVPTADEEEVVSNLLELNLKKGVSFTENGQAISKAVEAKQNSLNKKLAKSKVKLNKKELLSDLKNVADNLQSKNPALVGDAEKSAQKIFNLVEVLVKESDGSALSILNIRRQIDKELSKLGKGGWDGNKQNGIDIASRAMRDRLNLKVAEAVPDVNVQKDLRKMHLWLKAHDNVLDKAANDANLKVGRIVQNIEGATGTKAPTTAISKYIAGSLAITGVAGIAASGYLPLVTAVSAAGAIGYAIKRGAVSPNVRKSLGVMLRSADDAIKATNNSAMKKAIAADRAFIVEIMKLPTTQAEDITEEEMKEAGL